MAETRKAILLRISPGLWAGLNRWAAAELRSVNAQIEFLLREAVREREGDVDEETDDEIGAAFWPLHPELRALGENLRKLGLADRAQRLEGAVAFSATPALIVANVRANLKELLSGPVQLPSEIAEPALRIFEVLGNLGVRVGK